MTNPTIPQTVRFPDLFDKPLVATFDREQASSDGGAVLLKAAERVYGLVKAFARCLVDKRAPEKVRHTLEDLVGQRVFGIACGHPDGNDADHLADDPIHKLLLGRDPVAGGRLVSQPTISRFENDAGRSALYRMGRELAASVIERHRRRLGGRARRITIDLDPTDDRTHGAQQLTFFNSHYDSWCYWGAPSLLGHGLRENPMSPGGGGMVRSRQVKGAGSAPTGSGALAPGQRWSASRKRDVVLRLLRSEPLDAVSREVGVEVYRLERWKVRALAGLERGLKEQAGEPLAAELDAAKRHIGELSMDNELLRSRARAAERRLPLATRRSRR